MTPHIDTEGTPIPSQPDRLFLELLPAGTTLHEFVAVHPDQQREIDPHGGADSTDYLQTEADAFLE
jgi:hypothetical protein